MNITTHSERSRDTNALDSRFDGHHAIVTGAARGIGAAIASALVARGARVTLMGRDREALERHATQLQPEGHRFVGIEPCDVTDETSVRTAFERATTRFGAPHILVNNAGQSESVAFTDMTRDVWDHMLAVNLTGTYLCTAQVLPAMIAAGNGRIVNIASTAGLRGYKRTAAYCAAKHGVIGLTRALALETAKHGVTVNAVCPGYTATGMTDTAVQNLVTNLGKTPDEALAMLTRPIPRGQLTTPDEVAHAVVWLCTPGAAAVTGIALPVAGGEVT